MKIKKDIADLKAFMDNIEDEVVDFMDEKAHESLIEQKAARLLSGKRDYLNHTWNLRSSLGYAVIYRESKSYGSDSGCRSE